MTKTIKAASRHLLFAEFILGVFLTAWGANKGADIGFVKGWSNLSAISGWLVPAIIGALQACAAATEWCLGKTWPLPQLQKHCAARAIIALMAAGLWIYGLKEFALDPQVVLAVVVLLVAPVCVGVNLYSVYENRKVWAALDPNLSTSTLRFDR